MNVIMKIVEWIRDIPYHLRCRFKYKLYMIPLRGFSKWSWHEDDDRLMHGMMEVLRHYVEDQEPWDVKMILDGKVAELKNEVYEQDNENAREMLNNQTNDAIEIHKIYRWWKEEHPALSQKIEDLYDKLGEMRGELKFVQISEEDDPEAYKGARKFNIKGPLCELITDETKEEKTASDKLIRVIWAVEEELNKQETKMLCKLIELRGRLWT